MRSEDNNLNVFEEFCVERPYDVRGPIFSGTIPNHHPGSMKQSHIDRIPTGYGPEAGEAGSSTNVNVEHPR